MANNGLPGHVAGTSALLPTADVRAPMSALAPISSASPPGADLPGGVAEGQAEGSVADVDVTQIQSWACSVGINRQVPSA